MPSKKDVSKQKAKISRDSLSDSYIISLLRKLYRSSGNHEVATAAEIRKRPIIIEIKRAQIQLWRAIKAKKEENLNNQ